MPVRLFYFYITITESRRKIEHDGRFTYDKHKIFLYKEDFDKFAEGLQDAINYLRSNQLKDEPKDNFKGGKSSEEEW